jgi:hypothetical protein
MQNMVRLLGYVHHARRKLCKKIGSHGLQENPLFAIGKITWREGTS